MSKRKTYTQKQYESIIKRWKANEISLHDAAAELDRLGTHKGSDAWAHLQAI